ncbi:RHS repeat-associated core domain-containing protein [Hydrogenophaga sp. 5NK40-0174]|uniref:RHS repeat-associated core domain-containing protein n=1 Tax=Hydrogenophaga sp. 5NK40-0174 TaxID=3127649 RepID=UPI003102441A
MLKLNRALNWVGAGVLMLATAGVAHAQVSTITRTSSFEYDADGLLQKEVVEPDSAQHCLQTTYAYDGYGNRVSSSSSACAGATGHAVASAAVARTASAQYQAQTVSIDGQSYSSPAGLFMTERSNALGHAEQREYDPRSGRMTKLVGPNTGVTRWAYDGFGRVTHEYRADGTQTVKSYHLCAVEGQPRDPVCPQTVGKDLFQHTVDWYSSTADLDANGVPSSVTVLAFFDTLGRKVRVQSQSLDGQAVVQDLVFDELGRTHASSVAYLRDSGQPFWTTLEYDLVGRVIQESMPDGHGGTVHETTSYDGLSVTQVNAKGQSKTTMRNAMGQVEFVIDALGSKTDYAYNAQGRLIETQAAGIVSRMSYDVHGNKTMLQDPSMGRHDYAYNVFGELVWKKDSLGQETSVSYDVLGRRVQRNEADLVSNWYFDKKSDGTACGSGIGKLCEATADNGYQRTHSYDALGRLTATATTLDNAAAPAAMSWAYDSVTGRVSSKTWPTGYKATFEYTSEGGGATPGFLYRVKGIETSGAVNASLQVLARDESGRIKEYVTGNGVVTAKSRNAETGWLEGVAGSSGVAGESLFDRQYTYDELGNVLTRVEGHGGVSESFAYDSVNRLSMYTAVGGGLDSGATSIQVLYDAIGNIKFKSDVGYFHYDGQRPQRLNAVTTAPSANWSAMGSVMVANTGTKALAYAFDDFGGNARSIEQASGGSLPMGNGNLAYTVSQDNASGAHTVRWETYTGFNKIAQIQFGNVSDPQDPTAAVAERTMSYVYGPEHQRIRQTIALGQNAPSHMEAGTTWYLNGTGGQFLNYEKRVLGSGLVEHQHYLVAEGISFAIHTKREGVLGGKPESSVGYLHQDGLGSLIAVTDASGAVTERPAYDPWGKRRHTNGLPDVNAQLFGDLTDRGFTMHEHMDEVGTINMNGRIYDPLVARFVSADPNVQAPFELQSFNRYAYVWNNPLTKTDPSGFFMSGESDSTSNVSGGGSTGSGGYTIGGGFSGFGQHTWGSSAGNGLHWGPGPVHSSDTSGYTGTTYGYPNGLSPMDHYSIGSEDPRTPVNGDGGGAGAGFGSVASAAGGSAVNGGARQPYASALTFEVLRAASQEERVRVTNASVTAPARQAITFVLGLAAAATQTPGFQEAADDFFSGLSSVFSQPPSADEGEDASDSLDANPPSLPTDIVGDQSDERAGPNKDGTRWTSGTLRPERGGTGDFADDLDHLSGGVRPWQPGDRAPPGSLVGANGIFGRPTNSSGGASIDIPANGSKPHETLHYP